MRRAVVVPVYGNEESLPDLLRQMAALHERYPELEGIFVVDGSPDNSYALLRMRLPMMPFRSKLVSLSRNFGSHAAIRAGMTAADAESIAVLAADLQQPVSSIDQFFEALDAGADIVVGERSSRDDRWTSRVASDLFWALYRRFVDRRVPRGGVDSFACTRQVRDVLVSLPESSSNLLGLLFWVGFSRATVSYPRGARMSGRSGWTIARRLRYAFDTAFAFSDLPITVMMTAGILGIGAAITVRRDPAGGAPDPLGGSAWLHGDHAGRPVLVLHAAARARHHRRLRLAYLREHQGPPVIPREFGGIHRAAHQRAGRRRARVRRRVDPGAATMAVAAFVWHIILMSGAANDNFMHMAMAQQWLAGDWPVRDFFDNGRFLQYSLSALAQLTIGDRLLGEALIAGLAWAISTYLVFVLVRRLTDSFPAAFLASLLLIVAGARGYSYPKGIVYAVAAVLWWDYVRRPSVQTIVAFGAWVAVAYYWRPDHGVFAALGLVVAAVTAHGFRRETRHPGCARGRHDTCAGDSLLDLHPGDRGVAAVRADSSGGGARGARDTWPA